MAENEKKEELTRADVIMLMCLYESRCTTNLTSFTKYELHSKLSENNTKISERTVYMNLLKLKRMKLVENGVNYGRCKTYYITQDGINQIRKNGSEDKNVKE